MNRRRRGWWAAACAIAAVALGAAGCGREDAPSGEAASGLAGQAGPAHFGEPTSGGTFRVGVSDLQFTNAFDPTGEYLNTAWSVYGLMLRPLLGYRQTAGAAGNELVPDLAQALPVVSPDGLTYTLTLRRGVRFSPPVSRPITSRDVSYAFERIATPSLAAQYGFYFDVVERIETPDDRTIVFHLSEPAGDFAARLALPATAPIPEEVARCATRAGDYGRYVVASGPYMLEGTERMDISGCDAMRPIAGYRPTRGMTLVRNPEHDPTTDTGVARDALPDRFELTVNTSQSDVYDRLEAGLLEAAFTPAAPAVLRRHLTRDELRPRLRLNAGDRVSFITMNMALPPFDDVHVRRALNMAMDLDALRRASGGPVSGEIATHLVPDDLTGGRLSSSAYHPFQAPPFDGDLEAARAEMALSPYDADGDGRCDAAACRDVLAINADEAPWTTMSPIVRESAAAIGIDLRVREMPLSAAQTVAGTPSRRVPMTLFVGFLKDVPDPLPFMELLRSSAILPSGTTNLAMVGLSRARADELGLPYPDGGIPSVDAEIDACARLAGGDRMDCWAALDRMVTETVVPYVPYLDGLNADVIGPAVTAYDYDQFSGLIALGRVAVDPSLQR